MKAMDKFKGAMGDVKTRTIIIFTGFIVIVAVGVALTGLKHNSQVDNTETAASRTAKIKRDQGEGQLGIADKEYNELQRRQNTEEASTAIKVGGAAVPTLVGDQLSQLDSAVLSIDQGAQTPESAEKLRQDAAAEYQRKLAEEAQSAADRAAAEAAAKSAAQAAAGDAQKEQAFEALMTTQATALFKLWQPPVMGYKAGANFSTLLPAVATPPGEGGTTPGAPGTPSKAVMKAGDIMFGILETAVNSDEPGPIMAKIVSGPLQGSKLIGGMVVAGQNAQKASLNFTVLSTPSVPNSVAINAVAIDPETSRTAIATDVDNHYLLRYGSMLGGGFLEGMGNAVTEGIKNPGLTTTTDGTSGTIAPSAIAVSTRDQIISGFGAMGTKIGENLNYFNRPATITIASGTSIGVLLLSDLTFDKPAANVAPPSSPTTSGVGGAMNALKEVGQAASAVGTLANNVNKTLPSKP